MIAYTDYAIDARVRREAETLAAHGFQVRCLTTKNGASAEAFRARWRRSSGAERSEIPRQEHAARTVASYLRFLVVGVGWRACALLLSGELDVVHVHNIPDFLVFAGLLPRVWPAAKSCSTSTIRCRKRSRPSSPSADRCLEGALPRGAAERARRAPGHLRQSSAARHAGGPRHPDVEDVHLDERPGPDDLQRGRHRPRRDRRRRSASTSSTTARWPSGSAWTCVIRAVARLQDRIPGFSLHLWGHGDDLAAFQALAQELDVERSRCCSSPSGFPLQELPDALRGDGHRGRRQPAKRRRRSDAAGQAAGVRLAGHSGGRAAPEDDRALLHRRHGRVLRARRCRVAGGCHLPPVPRARTCGGGRRQRADAFLDDYGWERQGDGARDLLSNAWWRTESHEQVAIRPGRVRQHRAQARARAARTTSTRRKSARSSISTSRGRRSSRRSTARRRSSSVARDDARRRRSDRRLQRADAERRPLRERARPRASTAGRSSSRSRWRSGSRMPIG